MFNKIRIIELYNAGFLMNGTRHFLNWRLMMFPFLEFYLKTNFHARNIMDNTFII